MGFYSIVLCPQISAEFRRLAPVFQEVIADITRRMGEGMTVFLEAKIDSLEQWDEVSHMLLRYHGNCSTIIL